jgi:hypothetical protein
MVDYLGSLCTVNVIVLGPLIHLMLRRALPFGSWYFDGEMP